MEQHIFNVAVDYMGTTEKASSFNITEVVLPEKCWFQ
jgi:hypothetical protein